MRPPNAHTEDICRDRTLEGMTHAELGKRYDLDRRQIGKILSSPGGVQYKEKYKRLRDEKVKEGLEVVKKRAGMDAEEYYVRLRGMALQKEVIKCPECNCEIKIDVASATKLRALLSALGIGGIKIKQDEDLEKDLPKLTIRARKKPLELSKAVKDKKAG